MTTARDLMTIALDAAPSRPVEPGDLSLALAGAEVVDLLAAEAVTLDGDRIVPGLGPATDDPLLSRAASALVRERPYELVGDWLWRRGRGLSAAYLAALEAEGLFGRQRRRGLFSRERRVTRADTPDRRAAVERLASAEPVLAALTSALGLPGPGGSSESSETVGPGGLGGPGSLGSQDEQGGQDETGRRAGSGEAREGPGAGGSPGGSAGVSDDVDTVLAAVLDALTQLQAIRQRRAVEQAAFDNVWRGD
ncbi:GPP34 family phosphoprotein [Streptomyces tirandamycinicus]|uniref:GPP34 family phosphoprotein n=1 Tax=Streptomyces tirandamycinicus TaxID=2174846 RepID=UPI0034473693